MSEWMNDERFLILDLQPKASRYFLCAEASLGCWWFLDKEAVLPPMVLELKTLMSMCHMAETRAREWGG